MNKKILLLIFLCLVSLSLFADDGNISFSGGTSSITLQEGDRSVTLTQGATVTVNSLVITADTITITGDNYENIACLGSILINDSERGLAIRTSRLHYDRANERLLIPSWSEISDSQNELVASASALYYDMDAELLELQMNVSLAKNTNSGIMSAKAERVTYDRAGSLLTLAGNASVTWDDDSYSASVIAINLDTEEIRLDGQIGGTING